MSRNDARFRLTLEGDDGSDARRVTSISGADAGFNTNPQCVLYQKLGDSCARRFTAVQGGST